MNKPSKTLLITDLCLFAFAVGFFFVCSVLKNLFPVTASPINICLFAVCALAVILLMLFQYRGRQAVGIINIIISFALSIALYGVYHLPVFAFIGEKGIQNGICGLFVFTLFSRYALNLSIYLKNNHGYAVTSSNLRANVQGRGVITGAYVMAKVLKTFAIFIFLGGVFMAMFNAFMPVIDISTPYQIVFLHKTLAEVMKH